LTKLIRRSPKHGDEGQKISTNRLYLMADGPFERFLAQVDEDTDLDEIEEALSQCRKRRRAGYFRKSIEIDKVRSVFHLTGVKGPLRNEAEETECLECMHLWIDDLVKQERKSRILPVVTRDRILRDPNLPEVRMPNWNPALSLRRLPWETSGKDRRTGNFDARVHASVPLSSKGQEATLYTGIWLEALHCPLPSADTVQVNPNLKLAAEESESSRNIDSSSFTAFLQSLGLPTSAVTTEVGTERIESGFEVNFAVSHREQPAKRLFEESIKLDGDTLSRGSENALHGKVKKMRKQFFKSARDTTIPALRKVNGFALSNIRPSPIRGAPSGLFFRATIDLGAGIKSDALVFLDETKGGEIILQPEFGHRVRREILRSLLRNEGLERLASSSTLEQEINTEEGILRGRVRIDGKSYDWGFSDESQRIYWESPKDLEEAKKSADNSASSLSKAGENNLEKAKKILRSHKLGEAMRLEELELSPDGGRISLSLKIADWPELLVEGLGKFGFDDSESLRQLEEFLSEESLAEELREAARQGWSREFDHPRFGKVSAELSHLPQGQGGEARFEVDFQAGGKMKDMLQLSDVCLRIGGGQWEVLNEVEVQMSIKGLVEDLFLNDSMNLLLAPFELAGSIELDEGAFGEGRWLRLNPLRIAAKVEIFFPLTQNGIRTSGTLSFEDGWNWANRRIEVSLGEVRFDDEVSLGGAKAALDFARRKADLELSMKLSDNGLNMGAMKASTTWGKGEKLDFESYSFEGTLAMLGEGQLGHLAGTFEEKTEQRNFGFAAEATSAEFSLDEFFAVSGEVAYRHKENVLAGADFSMGLMSGGGGTMKVSLEEDQADPEKAVEIEEVGADLQARFPILNFLPGSIRISGEAGELNQQPFSFSVLEERLELYGEATVTFLTMQAKVRVWAKTNGIKDWELIFDTPEGPVTLLGGGEIVESMGGDELKGKIERMLLDKLDKKKVDDAIGDSPEGNKLRDLVGDSYKQEGNNYVLRDGVNEEKMKELVETFTKENERLKTEGKEPAFAPILPEPSDEELVIIDELPERTLKPGNPPDDNDWKIGDVFRENSGLEGKRANRTSKPISNVAPVVSGNEVTIVSTKSRDMAPYARFKTWQLGYKDGHDLDGFKIYRDGTENVLYAFDTNSQSIKGALFRAENGNFLKKLDIQPAGKQNLEEKLKRSYLSQNWPAANTYMFSIFHYNRIRSLGLECKIIQKGSDSFPLILVGPNEYGINSLFMADQKKMNSNFITFISFDELENSTVLYDFIKTFAFRGKTAFLLHIDKQKESGIFLHTANKPTESFLRLHGEKGNTGIPAKFQSLPSPENSRFLHSYLSTPTAKEEVTKVALSAYGFCTLWSRNEEAYLYIRAFAEKDGVWVRLEDFQKELSNRENLRRLLPDKLKSVQGRTEAIEEEDFPLVIVEQAEWKKLGWKANPMGILRALKQGN
jgi:hypothetical protein